MSLPLDYAGLVRLLAELVAKKQTCTLLGRTDDNHALMVGLRGGEIGLFVYAGKQGWPAIAAARGISMLTLRREDMGVPAGRSDMPPTPEIMQALAPESSAPVGALPATAAARPAPIAPAPATGHDDVPQRAETPNPTPLAPPAQASFMDTVRAVAIAERASESLRRVRRPDPAAPLAPALNVEYPAPPQLRPTVPPSRPPNTPEAAPLRAAAGGSADFSGRAAPELRNTEWAKLFERAEPMFATDAVFEGVRTTFGSRRGDQPQDAVAGTAAVVSPAAIHNHRAWQLFRKGDYDAALAELDAAKVLDPDNPTFLANIKRIERRMHTDAEPEANPWAAP